MIIETKYDKGDSVYFIHDDDLYYREIRGIEYLYGTISYRFLLKPAQTTMDQERWVSKEEGKCFGSLQDIETQKIK